MVSNTVNVVCSPSFQGVNKKTEKGNPYYHTNSAMKIGGVFAGLSTIGVCYDYLANKTSMDILKPSNIELPNDVASNLKNILKKNKNYCLLGGLLTVAGHLFAASYIDNKRNKKAKEVADLAQEKDAKDLVMTEKDLRLSRKNNVYLDSNIGSKAGGWLGAAIGLVSGTFAYAKQNSLLKSLMKNSVEKLPEELKYVNKYLKAGGLLAIPVSVGLSALGGWLLGKWSDNIANKDMFKNA